MLQEGLLVSKLAGGRLMVLVVVSLRIPHLSQLSSQGYSRPLQHYGRIMWHIRNGCNVHISCDCKDTISTVSRETQPQIFKDSHITNYSLHFRTKSVVNFLLFFTVNRGAFVALTQMAYFATFMAAPSKTYWYVRLHGGQIPFYTCIQDAIPPKRQQASC